MLGTEVIVTTTTRTSTVKLTPLVGALCDPLRPTFLFGCTPPRDGTTTEEAEKIARMFVDRSRVLATDGFIVYDVQDEVSRTDTPRPFNFRKLMDPSWFASVLTKLSGKECVVYKAATCCDSHAQFEEWVNECVGEHGHTAINIVGAPSASYVSDGPSVREAAAIANGTATAAGSAAAGSSSSSSRKSLVKFGCVAIAERHTKKACEHKIMLKKASWGAEWFITQGIFDPEPMVALLNDYGALCAAEGVSPKKVILTFTPCGRKKTMQFVKWLGMNVPADVEARIFAKPPVAATVETVVPPTPPTPAAAGGAAAPAAPAAALPKKTTTTTKKKKVVVKTAVLISCDVMCENLRRILDGVRGEAGAAVPLGINVESVSGYRNEIDATHVLFRDLQAIVLDEFTAQSGTHWAVRWHPCLPQRSGGVGGRDRSGSTAPRDLAELGNADVCRLALALELGAFVEALRREQIVGEDLADAEFTVASLDDIVEGRAVLKKRFMRRLQELRLNGVPIQLL